MKTKFTILIILLIGICFSFGCRTPKEQAQRHLKKALRLDPSIIKERTRDTTIFGVAIGKDTTIRKGTSNDVGFDCDSLKALLNSERAKVDAQGNRSTMLYTDSAKSLEVIKSKNGKLFARITTPADTIVKIVKVPYKVEVKVPGETITIYEDKPAYTYFWFWCLCGVIVVFVYLVISRVVFKKDIIKTILIKDKNDTDTV